MPRSGKQTWHFTHSVGIDAVGTAAGKLESEGPFGSMFDAQHTEDRLGQPSWEQAEQQLVKEASEQAMSKAGVTDTDLDLVVGGDLNAQLSGFYFGTRHLSIPAVGVFSACASITEALALSALTIDSGVTKRALVGTSSHNSTAERQFRYPTEYGVQKPPSAQRTVTGAGMAVLSQGGGNVRITHATIGQVCDFGIKSPWEMGAAMAPAAKSTISAHFKDTGTNFDDYDCVATGDLGRVGLAILKDLFAADGVDPGDVLRDCGAMIYRPDQPDVFSGGSGGACCTLVTYAYLLSQLETGAWRRVLVCATGALLSAVTAQQSQSIPGICHAVALERKD